jgi:hypothetical protein
MDWEKTTKRQSGAKKNTCIILNNIIGNALRNLSPIKLNQPAVQ